MNVESPENQSIIHSELKQHAAISRTSKSWTVLVISIHTPGLSPHPPDLKIINRDHPPVANTLLYTLIIPSLSQFLLTMDSKEPTVMASHIEDTPVKGGKTVEETDLALGLLLNDEERELGLIKSAWKHKRIIFMCKY